MTELMIGSVVPECEALATGNQRIKLTDYRGHYVVLYFYPKDNTSGCTQEAQNFRDDYQKFRDLNTVIFGISRDSVRVHDGFKSKQALPFDLLSDQDESLCQRFDVLKMKMMYGKQVKGIERSTFLINPEGVLVQQWRKVKVADHSAAVLAAVTALINAN